MAPLSHTFRLAAFFLLSILLLAVAPAPCLGNGFSLELIHRDSTRSILYPGNLTDSQRLHRLLQLSKTRFPSRKSINVTIARPPLSYMTGMYTVAVSFGSELQLMSYQLWLNMGSALTWIQCQPCDPCFHQSSPIFDPRRSPTYHHLPVDRCPHGFNVHDNKCTYDLRDEHSPSYVKGVLATDAVTFHSSRGHGQFEVLLLMFGCTHASHIEFNGAPQGVLGLDDRRTSFLRQMYSHIGGRYSYCLPTGVEDRSYLRFGSDIIMPGSIHTTRFTTIDGLHYINILDFTVGNHKLHIPPGTFLTRGVYGGSVDMSIPFTRLVRPAYNAVKNYLISYFRHFNQLHRIQPEHGVGLCYRMGSHFDQFPAMTIHLWGTDLHLRWQQVFTIDRDRHIFCLAMEETLHGTVIGAFQQVNTRFKFDLQYKELTFASEDCSRTG